MPEPLIVAAGVIYRADGLILLARRRPGKMFGGMWEFPGGKIEPGEALEDCLVRELREEFGVETIVERHLVTNTFMDDELPIELHTYIVRHLSGVFVPTDHDAITWVTPSELASFNLTNADRLAAEMLAAGRDS
jgi:mutator protein MutT